MRLKIIKKIIRYSSIASLVFSVGCSYINPAPKPNLLDEYPTISHKASALLENHPKKINVDIISEEKLPMYKDRFTTSTIGGVGILSYNARNLDATTLKSTLEEQLGNGVGKVSVIPETNQILIRLGRNGAKTTNSLEQAVSQEEVMSLIEGVDRDPPQIMMDLRIVRIFADYTRDISSFLNIKPEENKGLSPALLMSLPGAKLRVPERAAESGLGVEYGLIGEIGKYMLDARLDQLESQGFAEDLAANSLVVSNGRKAEIRLTQELPYRDEVLSQTGVLLALTKYKEIDNFLELTPSARDDGIIYLDISAGVASYNPTGVLQIPGITKRNVRIGGVEVKQGETIVLGGFRIDHNIAIERKDPWLSNIPILNYFFRGDDKEKSTNEVLFIATPHYVDVNKKKGISQLSKLPEVDN